MHAEGKAKPRVEQAHPCKAGTPPTSCSASTRGSEAGSTAGWAALTDIHPSLSGGCGGGEGVISCSYSSLWQGRGALGGLLVTDSVARLL